jgi:hypothetical protein
MTTPASKTHRTIDLRQSLGALAVDRPDDGFRAALHRRLATEPAPAPLRWSDRARAWLRDRRAWMWPAAGVAAGVATFVVLVAVRGLPAEQPSVAVNSPPQLVSSGPVLPSFRVPSAKVAVIKLAFAAEVAVDDVTFAVTLPEGLAFWSQGKKLDERTFRWPGRLEAGENLIPIAVRTDRPGRFPVVATVEVGGRVLEHRVVLDVRREGT